MKDRISKHLGNNQRIEDALKQFSDAGDVMHRTILFIVPAYNEEKNISATIDEIRQTALTADVLVVNDASSDQTEMIAKNRNVEVINLPFNLGIGGAVQTGFKYALMHNYDLVVRVDGDGQHDPKFSDDLLMHLLKDEADMTIGSRFIPPFTSYQSSFIRRIGIHFFAMLISFISHYKITDPTSGFSAYNKKMIRLFSNYYPQDYPEPEAIVYAGIYQMRIQEVPVKMRKRTHGNSSIRYLLTLYYMIKVTLAILLVKIKAKKRMVDA